MAEPKNTSPSNVVAPSEQKLHTRTEESLEALIAQVDASEPVLSDKHIEKYFSLKSQTIKAVREDHKDLKDLEQHGRKYNLFYLIAGGAIVLIVIVLLGIFNKDYLGHFFELLFAFLGGTGVGTYFSNRNKSGE